MKLHHKIVIVIFVLLTTLVLHTLKFTGFFRVVNTHFEGKIIKEIPIWGAEDISVSHLDSFALISATKRIVYPPKEQEFGGLYLMELKSGNFNVKPLTSSFNQSFAPHGISMIKTDNSYKIMAINHSLQGNSIEVFNLVGDSLTHIKSLRDKTMVSPNDLVMVDKNKFYFTNDHKYTKGIGRFFEEYGGLAISNVIYFDGENYQQVANNIAFANGINFDNYRKLMFVASSRGFHIKVYQIQNNGSLNFIENIPCNTGVDNIELDIEGNLWTAGHPNLLKFQSYAIGKKDFAPSEIIKINYKGKKNYTVESVYLEDGRSISGSTVASIFSEYILTGSALDHKMLILKPSKE